MDLDAVATVVQIVGVTGEMRGTDSAFGPMVQSARFRDSHLDDDRALGLRAADEHTTGVRRIQRFFDIFHLTFDELAHAGVAYPRTTAVSGTQTMVLGQIQDRLAGGVPGSGESRAHKRYLHFTGQLLSRAPRWRLAEKSSLFR